MRVLRRIDLSRLTRLERVTRPELARLANTINQLGQAHLAQLQEWLASRGLAPYDPQQQPSSRKETDLQRYPGLAGPITTWPSSR